MKFLIKKGLAVLLTMALALGALPFYALAADNEKVLTGLYYAPTKSTATIVSVDAFEEGDKNSEVGTATASIGTVDIIAYTTDEDEEITFDSDDFNEVCKDATGSNLSYVKFTLPSISYGRLYYDYVSSSNYDSRVAATTKYYRSAARDIDEVAFVPSPARSILWWGKVPFPAL
jgi:hypothetical protein